MLIANNYSETFNVRVAFSYSRCKKCDEVFTFKKQFTAHNLTHKNQGVRKLVQLPCDMDLIALTLKLVTHVHLRLSYSKHRGLLNGTAGVFPIEIL